MAHTVPDQDTGPGRPTLRSTRFCVGDIGVTPESGAVSGPRGDAKLDPKVMDVLVCLARADGNLVSRDRIMETVWPGVVVTDFALSRCIYRLRKTLSAVSAAATSPIETLPKRGYRLAWAVALYEPARSRSAPADRPPLPFWKKATGLLVAAGMIAVFIFRDADQTITSGPSSARSVRVAVLPLEDLSVDGSETVFANGLTREIMHEVASIPGVVAIGRSSVFEIATAGIPPLDTAQRLDAKFVISGNVSPVGGARRVLVDLSAVPSGELIWSHSYLIGSDAPFVMLPRLAQSVATILDFSTTRAANSGMTDNLAAFEAYLAATEAEGVETKRQLLGRAVELDPEFAAGWAALAGIEVMPVWNGQVPIEEAWPRAKPSLDRAFELDPDLPSAFVTLGRFQRELGDIEAAIASFDRALQLDPGYGSASANLGLALRFSGRYEAALAVHETAAAMDPLSPAVQTRLGTSYWFIGDFESAARHYQIAIDLNPSYEESYDSWAGMLGAGLGRFDEALTMIQRKMALPGEPTVRTLATAGTLSSILGMDAAAHEYWRRGREINPEYAGIYSDMARHHLLRGDDSAARQAAQAALERFPLDTQAQLVLAILDLENGNADAFVQRVGTAYADYMGDPPVIDRAHLDIALLIALAYDAAGAQADKLRVLQEMDAAVETPRAGQYVSLAAMHAMRNEPESALRDLRNSPPGRVRLWAPLAMRDPRVAALRDDEAFRALISGHLEELKMQAVTTETARSVQPDRQPWRDSLRFTASDLDALPGPTTGIHPRKRRPTTPD